MGPSYNKPTSLYWNDSGVSVAHDKNISFLGDIFIHAVGAKFLKLRVQMLGIMIALWLAIVVADFVTYFDSSYTKSSSRVQTQLRVLDVKNKNSKKDIMQAVVLQQALTQYKERWA